MFVMWHSAGIRADKSGGFRAVFGTSSARVLTDHIKVPQLHLDEELRIGAVLPALGSDARYLRSHHG